ncbi:hypothetical protein B7P43_G18223, partial [Cryptotermes secundus]
FTANGYVTILGDQVNPMVQTLFPNADTIYQDNVHINIIEPLWSVLESYLRARYPPPSSLTELANVLQEEWYKTPLQIIQDLYLSIPRRLQEVLQARGCPTPYW